MQRRIHLRITGRVQGVCYRAHASDQAQALGLSGWVRNRLDGSVELVAEGDEPALRALVDWCHDGSPWAAVDGVKQEWADATGEHTGFQVTPTR